MIRNLPLDSDIPSGSEFVAQIEVSRQRLPDTIAWERSEATSEWVALIEISHPNSERGAYELRYRDQEPEWLRISGGDGMSFQLAREILGIAENGLYDASGSSMNPSC